ncbi:isopentenyl phosphate kinase-like [Lytechinus variegatus]|uniref:isopentenyl phosphate kinase-like n=1 Tax=Lytechinus variegatus TaxID=7654 RepID=UPI001BB26590|nr:isopentenyl phosphate kinase-like [Lytechinus variegatus]
MECIVKVGGSAITEKLELETINFDNLVKTAELLSKLKGKFILVHGAGSFGHFQASEYGVSKGYTSLSSDEQLRVKEGFCRARLSVTKLNHMIVNALVEKGVPAVGFSPCGRWRMKGRGQVRSSDCEKVNELLEAGFLPVLHGDCVLDEDLGCTILSGDTIIQVLCEFFKPKRVVFLSDVEGVFTKPPTDPEAKLLPRIHVREDGSLATSITTRQLDHDVTGASRRR